MRERDGVAVYPRTVHQTDPLPGAVEVLREILAQQDDLSTIIVTVGFYTNLAALLRSGPDSHSNLSGLELVRKKVRLLSLMGGMFTAEAEQEFNIKTDPESASEVFAYWPTDIVISGFEIGLSITYPATSIATDFTYVSDHPIKDSYETFAPMPYDRPTWDLTAVLCAVETNSGLFDFSPYGTITLDAKHVTRFRANPKGRHRYVILRESKIPEITNLMIKFVSRPPKNLAFP
jgi:inosine-uridine nucleoside N-ribohydrolase